MEAKLKHLEFIQAAISRMAQNSFLIKGWSVTLVSALFAFAAAGHDHRYVLISYIAIPAFWILDGFFIATERRFRALYDEARKQEATDVDFALDPTPFAKDHPWISGIFSKTLLVFYPVFIGLTLLVMFALQPTDKPNKTSQINALPAATSTTAMTIQRSTVHSERALDRA